MQSVRRVFPFARISRKRHRPIRLPPTPPRLRRRRRWPRRAIQPGLARIIRPPDTRRVKTFLARDSLSRPKGWALGSGPAVCAISHPAHFGRVVRPGAERVPAAAVHRSADQLLTTPGGGPGQRHFSAASRRVGREPRHKFPFRGRGPAFAPLANDFPFPSVLARRVATSRK